MTQKEGQAGTLERQISPGIDVSERATSGVGEALPESPLIDSEVAASSADESVPEDRDPSSDVAEEIRFLEGGPVTPSDSAMPSEPIAVVLGAIEERLTSLESVVRSAKQSASDQASVVRELHGQLQEARAGLHWMILRPALLDLLKLHDGLSSAITAAEGTRVVAVETLDDFRQDILDLLYRQGFEPYEAPGDRFDPKTQQASRLRPSPTPDGVGTVYERIAPGFRSDEKILRPEKVAVYKAEASPSAG